MRENVTYVTQSKFFTPAFNAAIFDGPIRIYFAQYQEAQALKLYFNLQERFSDIRREARGIFKDRGRNIFVMLYPTEETFDLSFGAAESRSQGTGAESGLNLPALIVSEQLGSDYVVGVRGTLTEETLSFLCLELDQIVRTADVPWETHAASLRSPVRDAT
jgi:hypothetical protein